VTVPRSNLDVLRTLGLFLIPDFFPTTLCRELRLAVERWPAEAAYIFAEGVASVDERVRRAESCDISEAAPSISVCDRLKAVLPTIATHFGVPLTSYEPPQIVRYRVGGYYRPHVDASRSSAGPAVLRHRTVSCVVFLNGSEDAADNANFVGGALAFFRLVEPPTFDNCKTFLYPVSGLLVAFRSSIYHEVLPVIAGERFTLVTWFG
jgi:SM-20-related protein